MKKIIILLGIIASLFYGCNENSTIPEQDDSITDTISINGFVQKGPYINGTAVNVYELNTDLNQTGKSYTTQIIDNKGTFELQNLAIKSKYIELKADGYYFNEVTNEASISTLTLYALADVNDHTTFNVNILSYLEKGRLKFLVDRGVAFETAKAQAQNEILAIFNIQTADNIPSEQLDISQDGDNNAALLAVSVILQGYLSVAELSELLANMSTDIREDGILDSETLGSQLINSAKKLNLEEIRNNLEKRYETLGLTILVADFEKYVNHFIENTEFIATDRITFPVSGAFGPNILNEENTEFCSGNFSMAAELPDGFSLKVILYSDLLGAVYPQLDNNGWDAEHIGMVGNLYKNIYTSNRYGSIDFKLYANQTEYTPQAYIEVYENNTMEMTWTKKLSCGNGSGFDVPEYGIYGFNLLSLKDSVMLDTSETYSVAIHLPADKIYDVNLTLSFWNDSTFTVDESKIINWSYSMSSNLIELNAYGSDLDFDLPIKFKSSGDLSIEGGGLILYGVHW